jgi:hypothetical protein
MYCDRDEAVLTWDTYNDRYKRIANKHPWILTHVEERAVEASVKPCPCGGRFAFANPPRCPSCHTELRDLVPDPIYFVVTGKRVDGDEVGAWQADAGDGAIPSTKTS